MRPDCGLGSAGVRLLIGLDGLIRRSQGNETTTHQEEGANRKSAEDLKVPEGLIEQSEERPFEASAGTF
jgi:hypothetical protein